MKTGNNHDVFFARGNGVDRNPGNIKYRELIARYNQDYKASTSTIENKNNIANTIISAIKQMGGIFYHQPIGGQGFEWEELDVKALQKKVKQSLRDSKVVRPSPSPTSSLDFQQEFFNDEDDEMNMKEEEMMDVDQYNEEPQLYIPNTTTSPPHSVDTVKEMRKVNYFHINNDCNRVEENHEFVPFQDSPHRNNHSTNEDHSHYHQSSINMETMMHASIGTIDGIQSMSMIDFNFSRSKAMMSFRRM